MIRLHPYCRCIWVMERWHLPYTPTFGWKAWVRRLYAEVVSQR